MTGEENQRISLQFLDYDNDILSVSKERMNYVFSNAITLPLKQVNFNVFAPNISSEKGSSALMDVVSAATEAFESNPSSSSIDFEPKGCEWKVVLSKSGPAIESGDENTNYWIHAVILDVGDSFETTYNIELSLHSPTQRGFLQGFNNKGTLAAKLFETIRYTVQKQLSRLEFPQFPDGNSGKTFRSMYQLNQELSEGSFGVVFRGLNRETKETVAVKSVNSKKLSAEDDAAIFTEVALMANMQHPHIVKLFDFFEEQGHYLMVLEYVEGGDLFDRVGRKSAYTEDDARSCSKILIDCIHYCHSNNVAHLDLKSKNLVLTSAEDDTKIKLIDFGFAQRVSGPNCLSRRCGTPYFVSPEIIRKEMYDQRADMWSVGVIIYLLLSGHLPFQGKNATELFKKVLAGEVEFTGSNWDFVSDHAKNLVKKLLDVNPDTRMSAERATSCAWLRQSSEMLKKNDLSKSSKHLATFNARMKLKAAVHAIGFAKVMGKHLTFKMDGDISNTLIDEVEIDTSFQEDELQN